MSNKNVNLNLGRLGMNKDSHPSSMGEHEFVHALNTNISDLNGNQVNAQNEHSNFLCSRFKDGFRVVGIVKDTTIDRTYFFLTDPSTRVSEIGYINVSHNVPTLDDIAASCDCDIRNKLSKPLEELEPFETCNYYTLISDDCNKCLNFSIYNPILTPIIKNEKCGKRIYWTDGVNPSRYIDLSNLQQYKEVGFSSCGEVLDATCLDCNKLRIFPNHSKLCFSVEEVEVGGRLAEGNYEIIGAYCDEVGNTLTDFMGQPQTVPIFNDNNINRIQPEALVRTNKAIRVELNGLNPSFAYYRLGIIYTAAADGSRQQFLSSVYDIDTKSVLITTDQNLETVPLNVLLQERVRYETVEGLATSGGTLFQYGLTSRRDINLQPVVNLMGGLLQWMTVQYKSDIYNDPVLAAKYKGYPRDESVPFSIRFNLDNGGHTRLMPLVGRPAKASDLVVVDNKDTQSVLNVQDNCTDTSRDKTWQYYNTASVDGSCEGTAESFNCEEITDYRKCVTPSVAGTIATLSFQLTESQYQEYTTLSEYITKYRTQIVDVSSDFYNATLASLINTISPNTCEPDLGVPLLSPSAFDADTTVTLTGTSGTANIVVDGTAYLVTFDTDLTTTASNWVAANAAAILSATGATVTSDAESILIEDSTPSLTTVEVINDTGDLDADVSSCEGCKEVSSEEYMEVSGLATEDVVVNLITPIPESTLNIDTCGYVIDDTSFCNDYQEVGLTVLDRQPTATHEVCSGAVGSTLEAAGVLNPIFMGLGIDDLEANLETTFISDNTALVGNFKPNLHVRAMWMSHTFEGSTNETLELKGFGGCLYSDDITNTTVRLSYYDGCPAAGVDSPIAFEEVDLSSSHIFSLDPADYPSGTVYIAIDAPITSATSGVTTKYYVETPCGCTALIKRDVAIDSIDIDVTDVELNFVHEYNLLCKFRSPVLDDCKPQPYKKGEFAYVESIINYPDNKELYDSSGLSISTSDLSSIPTDLRTRFESYYTDGDTGGVYDLKTETDLTCKPIRHFRMPDNNTAPFMSGNGNCSTETVFYPLGVTIDDSVVEAFLDIAVKNKIITKSERASIVGYEIFRGDRSVEKTVLSNGYLFDMYKYTEQDSDKEIWYPNYPYNDLGDDKLHFTSEARDTFIPHPYSRTANIKYTYHSPETEFEKRGLGTELKINGVAYGCSQGYFSEVEDHPEWGVLSRAAFRWSLVLAIAEAGADITAKVIEITSNHPISGTVGGALYAGLSIAVFGAKEVVKYRYQWLETFLGIIPTINYADYYTSVANYNQFKPVEDVENHLRGVLNPTYIKEGRLTIREGNNETRINNLDREQSVYLGLGAYDLQYNNYWLDNGIKFQDYDNSRFVESGTVDGVGNACNRGISREVGSRVSSLYATMKQYRPAQYGEINDVKWLPTGFCGRLGDDEDCRPIFGGDTFLGYHTFKRKLPLFVRDAFDLANETPYNYNYYKNIGYPRFYIDYLTEPTSSGLVAALVPQPYFGIKTDCEDDSSGAFDFHLSPEASFYLYYYGIPSLPVETTYNLSTRYAGVDKKDDFYPNYRDYVDWTQEKEVSVKRPNRYNYYDTFSNRVTKVPYSVFPNNWSKKEFECRKDLPNGLIYSERDLSESANTDPWLVYKPLNSHEFSTSQGKLVAINAMESGQILTRFRDSYQVDNVYDRFREELKSTNIELGGEGIFSKRPLSFNTTELGYGGTQHKAIVSCEFGHFWVDAKRGQVFQANAEGKVTDISVSNGNQPTNMSSWFKQNLPFKILKGGIKNLTDLDLDNNFRGLGIAMVWDSRFKRIILTKRDYVVKDAYKNKLRYKDGRITYNNLLVDFNNTDIFEDVSWTLGYNLIAGKWISAYSFKPDYYVPYNNYFKSGLNNPKDITEKGIWTHLLTNKSFQVFYGKKYPWVLELLLKEGFVNKTMHSLDIWLDVFRYHDEFNFSENRRLGFNKAIVYNNTQSTGLLELISEEPNNSNQYTKYPEFMRDRIKALYTMNDKSWSLNYLYNNVNNEFNNLPILLRDKNDLESSVNPAAMDYRPVYKDRLRGDWFIAKLEQDATSQYKFIHKFTLDKQQIFR